MNNQPKEIVFNSGKAIMYLLYFLGFLILAHLTGQILKFVFGYPHIFGLVRLFDFNAEQNIPTLFSTLLLVLNSFLFFILWKSRDSEVRNKWIWIFFAFVLLFLAIDEFAEIHETLSRPFHELFGTTGLLYYAWVIPYGVAFLLVVVFFIPVWWKLENRIRFLMAFSGFLYVLGAIGFEMLGGREYEKMGDQLSLNCSLLAAVEESLEMCGLILLLYVLIQMIGLEKEGFRLRVQPLDKNKPLNE
jgi:hypothetical protein